MVFLLMYIIGGFSATVLSYVYNFNKEYVGVAFLIGVILAVLVLKFSKNSEIKFDSKGLSQNKFKILTIIYTFSCVTLILILNNALLNYYLPFEYFIVLGICVFVIISQTFLSKDLSNFEQNFILLEIIVLSIVVYSSFLFLFPSPYGNDAPYHVEFINQIINSGKLSTPGQYQNYPIFHLFFVFSKLLSGISNLKVLQFFLLCIQVIFVTFIFLIVKKMFNTKSALMSTLIASFLPYLSQTKYFYFPGSFSAMFFILIFYLIFNGRELDFRYSLLLIIIFLTLIFSHPMTPIILLSALIIILIDSKLEFKKSVVSFSSILFVGIVTLSWWMKPSEVKTDDLFSYMIFSIQRSIETIDYTAVSRATLSGMVNPASIILNDLGFIMVISLSIFGAIFLLGNQLKKEKDSYYSNKTILAIITLIFIPIPYVLTMVYPQSLPNRWFPFIEVLASIFAGYGIYLFFENFINKKRIYEFAGIIFVVIMIFLMVSNPVINPNSQLYAKDLSVQSALTSSEMNSVNFINNYSDIKEIKGNSKYLAFVYQNASFENFLNPSDPETYLNGTLIIRTYDLQKGFTIPLYGSKGALLEINIPNKNFMQVLNNSNQIYNNGNLKMYERG